MEDSSKIALVVVAILVVAGLAFAQCSADVSGHTHDVAQAEAEKWAKDMGLNAKVNCADRDTDHDGYVSCPMVITDPSGASHIEAMECAGSFTTNNGCRVPKAVVRGNQ